MLSPWWSKSNSYVSKVLWYKLIKIVTKKIQHVGKSPWDWPFKALLCGEENGMDTSQFLPWKARCRTWAAKSWNNKKRTRRNKSLWQKILSNGRNDCVHSFRDGLQLTWLKRFSIVKPKAKELLRPIMKGSNNTMQPIRSRCKCTWQASSAGKRVRASREWFWYLIHLIGWERGASNFSQS